MEKGKEKQGTRGKGEKQMERVTEALGRKSCGGDIGAVMLWLSCAGLLLPMVK